MKIFEWLFSKKPEQKEEYTDERMTETMRIHRAQTKQGKKLNALIDELISNNRKTHNE